MKRKRALSVAVASSLLGRGEPAIWKAIREGKLHKFYLVGFGEKTAVRLLDFDEVVEIWRKGVEVGFEDRHRDLERRSYIITTPDKVELHVLGGVVTELSPQAEQERINRFTNRDNEGN